MSRYVDDDRGHSPRMSRREREKKKKRRMQEHEGAPTLIDTWGGPKSMGPGNAERQRREDYFFFLKFGMRVFMKG